MELTPLNEEGRKVIPFIRTGDYFFHRGIIAYRKNHLQRAVKLFQRAVKLTSKEPVFHVQLATVLSEMGHYERSNEILRTVLADHGDTEQEECYFFMANNYAYLGLFDKAQTAAETYIERCPDGNFVQDAKDLLDLLEVEYDGLSIWNDKNSGMEDEFIIEHEKARSFLKQGNCLSAIPILEAMTKQYPTYWAAYNHLAEAFFRIGDEERAYEICDHVFQEDPNNLFTRAILVLYLIRKGDSEQAEIFLEPLKAVYPIDFEHYLFVAEVLCAAGLYEHAVERFERMDETFYDTSAEWLHCYAVSLARTNHVKEAISSFNRAAALGYVQSKRVLSGYEADQLSIVQVTYHPWNHK